MAGIEPATSSLPRTRSTPELHERGILLPVTRGQFTLGDRFKCPRRKWPAPPKAGGTYQSPLRCQKKSRMERNSSKPSQIRVFIPYRPLRGPYSHPQDLNEGPFPRQFPLFRELYRFQNVIHQPVLPPSPYHFARPPLRSPRKFAQAP